MAIHSSSQRASRLAVLCAVALAVSGFGAGSCQPAFEDATTEAGFVHSNGLLGPIGNWTDHHRASGGVAAGDYDGDGLIDLFVVRGNIGSNLLYRNLGDGTFEDVAEAVGLAEAPALQAGPAFVDFDGDGRLDLLVPGLDTPTRLYRGDGVGFSDATLVSGLWVERPTIAAAFGDPDLDGDLDVYLAHWATSLAGGVREQFFANRGGGVFEDATVASGIADTLPADSIRYPGLDLTFGPVFGDIDADGWPDLLIAADFGTSQVLRNRRDGTFEDVTPAAIDDENGMGSALGDFDNDCDLDWFVTSVWGPPDEPIDGVWGISGNRLYRNDGAGGFEDVSEAAGVRNGRWGWGACFADFDNDGDLDLFHTNGWHGGEGYLDDASRLFLSNGDGTFDERAVDLGIDDTGMGRGVACFDAERDGDIDVFVANLVGPPGFFRNTAPPANHWLTVQLAGPPGNTQGAGATVYVRTASATQMRNIQVGSRYASQDPAEAHFGLADEARVLSVAVHWPDGSISRVGPLPADRVLVVDFERDRAGGALGRLARRQTGCPAR